jgi:hypothetical protein
MPMYGQLLLGMLLIMVTVLVHGMSLDYLIRFLGRIWPTFNTIFPRHGKPLFLSVTVLGIFLAHVLEIWIWAIVFLWTQDVQGLESALYFSTVTFTTVGYGDVILSDQWRLLGSVESANGMLLFGWSTAFIFEVMRRIWNFDSNAADIKATSIS